MFNCELSELVLKTTHFGLFPEDALQKLLRFVKISKRGSESSLTTKKIAFEVWMEHQNLIGFLPEWRLGTISLLKV